MIRAVVLDLDGTLIDSITSGVALTQDLAESFGYPRPTFAALRRRWGLYWTALAEEFLPNVDKESFTAAWVLHEQQHGLHTPAYPGAREAVETLRQGHIVTIHTNRPTEASLPNRLREAQLPPELFHFIQTTGDGIAPKPDPRAFRTVLRRLSQEFDIRHPETVCVVSDRVEDGTMALSCGSTFIGVLTGAASREDFALLSDSAVRIVESIADVPQTLAVR